MEYRVEILGGSLRAAKPQELEDLLNEAAADRWSLCELSYKPNTSQLWVVLQRKPEGEAHRAPRRSWLSDWS